MPELSALLAAVEQTNQTLEDIEGELTDLRSELHNLPNKYIPRGEAAEKARKIRNGGIMVASLLFVLGLTVFMLVLYFKASIREEGLRRCRDNRNAIKELVMTAIADREIPANATPEMAVRIKDQNVQTGILRERLLSLDGAQPEKC